MKRLFRKVKDVSIFERISRKIRLPYLTSGTNHEDGQKAKVTHGKEHRLKLIFFLPNKF